MLFIAIVFMPLLIWGKDEQTTQEIGCYKLYLWCLVGFILQEIIYLYELKRQKPPDFLKSRYYQVMMAIGIIVFPLISFLYFESSSEKINFITVIMFSAGSVRIFKGMIASTKGKMSNEVEGYSGKNPYNYKDYFI